MKIPSEITMPKLYRLNPGFAFALGFLGFSLMPALALIAQANPSVLVCRAKEHLADAVNMVFEEMRAIRGKEKRNKIITQTMSFSF